MIREIVMPDLGATGGGAVMETWLVQPGAKVRAGQPLFVVTTDKATVEVEAFQDGVLREIRVNAGEMVPIGSVVALLTDTEDEPLNDPSAWRELGLQSAGPQPQASSSPPAGIEGAGRIRASPIARRLAKEGGIGLDFLSGSGRYGQILRRDVERALAARQPVSSPAPQIGSNPVPLSPMRLSIAARTVQSKGAVPHFYAGLTIDMSAALAFRNEVVRRAEARGWSRPSLTDVCLKATGMALQAFPGLNASFHDDAIIVHAEVNLGFVVGLEEGMIIPVIRGADRLNLYDLAARSGRLKTNAREGRLRAEEISGGTFTLSNLGMYGLEWFAAIINPPEAGILSLGAVGDRPVVVDGELSHHPRMDVTLAIDHRIVDGVTAARFLARFKYLLENPLDQALEGPQEPPS